MIDGKKVIAFTPSGRQRYMEILVRHVEWQHAMGYIDEWVLFNNSYTWQDAFYTRDLAASHPDWIKLVEVPIPNEGDGLVHGLDPKTRKRTVGRKAGPRPGRNAGHISTFYPYLKEHDCIYVRLDDDLCYLDPHSIERLVRDKIAHPEAWLSYPVIVNNTRMSYWLQEAGVIEHAGLTNVFLEPKAWRDGPFVESLHRQALPWAVAGKLSQKFRLPLNRVLSNTAASGVADPQYAEGHISVNCFAIDGKDMAACNVTRDEEGYLSDHRPKALNRRNRICGDSTVIHFAYHPCTAHMDASGLLAEYQTLANTIGMKERWPLPE